MTKEPIAREARACWALWGPVSGKPESLCSEKLQPHASRVAEKSEQVKRGVIARLLPRTHFVGFRGEEFHRAQMVFGPPDFIHRHNDIRLPGDVAPGDVVVFANGAENRPHKFAFNDSEHF